MGSRDPVFEPPHPFLSLEGLNHMVAALLVVGTQRLGPEFGREVLAMAEQLQAERGVETSFHDQ